MLFDSDEILRCKLWRKLDLDRRTIMNVVANVYVTRHLSNALAQ